MDAALTIRRESRGAVPYRDRQVTGNRSQHARCPENVENMQMFSSAGSVWKFRQYVYIPKKCLLASV